MRTIVLLSGGLDSTAALLWALWGDEKPEALFVDYGQPACARELASARNVAATLGVTLHECVVGRVYAETGAGLFTAKPSGTVDGRDVAFVPCRNPLLISAAAATGMSRWSGHHIRIVVGFNAQDALGFPDCTRAFIDAMREVLDRGAGWDGAFAIDSPWIFKPKAEVVAWVRQFDPERLDLLLSTWSCYRPDGPCGECTACIVRKGAGA